jgi:hypothetical protein
MHPGSWRPRTCPADGQNPPGRWITPGRSVWKPARSRDVPEAAPYTHLWRRRPVKLRQERHVCSNAGPGYPAKLRRSGMNGNVGPHRPPAETGRTRIHVAPTEIGGPHSACAYKHGAAKGAFRFGPLQACESGASPVPCSTLRSAATEDGQPPHSKTSRDFARFKPCRTGFGCSRWNQAPGGGLAARALYRLCIGYVLPMCWLCAPMGTGPHGST